MDEDLKDLIAAWLGAELPEARVDELKLRLRQNSELREALAQEIALMGQIRAVQSPEPRWMDLEELLEQQVRDQDFEARTMEKIAGRISRRPLFSPLAWAAAFVFLAAGAWFWWTMLPQKTVQTAPPTVAVVMEAESASGPAWYQTGERLAAGPLEISEGLLQMRFLSGATVTVQGPAELDLKSHSEAVVHKGIVVADVPPAAEGFRLQSAHWTAIDRGTVFGIDARDPEHASVHVLQGKVDLHRDTLKKPDLVLTTGQGTRLEAGPQATSIPAEPTLFPDTASLTERSAREKRLRFEAWKTASDRLSKDPSLLLYYDFENPNSHPGFLSNRAPGAKPGSEGVLVGGDWTSGRWPQKQARRFYRAGDLIRARPGVQLMEATFLAWVLFENTHQDSPFALMLSPKVAPGQVYWLVWPTAFSHAAAPMVSLVKTAAKGRDIHYPELATFSRPVQGRWMHLAVVHDPSSQRVRLYSNGVRVADHPMQISSPLDLEHVVFGNWGFNKEQRNFVGALDEVAIFTRALSDSEIAAHYAATHP